MMTRKITIQDISKAAGTSASSVSRVLTGNGAVSKEKRAAIEAAITQLKYRPSHIARGLKTSITFSVGLLLNDITNPFYSAIARGIEDIALQHGYSLILCNTSEDPARELHYLQVLQDKHVDGIILGPTYQNLDYLMEVAERVPVVQIDRQLDGLAISSVIADNEATAYAATRLMLERGFRRLALLSWQRHVSSLDTRAKGYHRALAEWAEPVEETLLLEAPGINSDAAAAICLPVLANRQHPLALLALNNQLGLGAIKAAKSLGLMIPRDMGLIVFDDHEVFPLLEPPITAIEQPAHEMGKRAMEILLMHMDEEDTSPRVEVLPMHLRLRGSI
jgi:LacI family transcriptional regulator